MRTVCYSGTPRMMLFIGWPQIFLTPTPSCSFVDVIGNICPPPLSYLVAYTHTQVNEIGKGLSLGTFPINYTFAAKKRKSERVLVNLAGAQNLHQSGGNPFSLFFLFHSLPHTLVCEQFDTCQQPGPGCQFAKGCKNFSRGTCRRKVLAAAWVP